MDHLTEINELDRLLDRAVPVAQIQKLAVVDIQKTKSLPIWSLQLGPNDLTLPAFLIVGGVHGLERVGSHVVMNFLAPLIEQCRWDDNLKELFQRMRLIAVPILNPGGMMLNQRSNPRGVDIMRNAAIQGDAKGQFLISGHRYSPKLPWYMGEENSSPEVETQALLDLVQKEILPSRFAMSLDVHSGFGMHDRLWYPYSSTRRSFPDQGIVDRMQKLLSQTHPFHFYKIEPQTSSYVIHGDPWSMKKIVPPVTNPAKCISRGA